MVAGTVADCRDALCSKYQRIKMNVFRTHVVDLKHDPDYAAVNGGGVGVLSVVVDAGKAGVVSPDMGMNLKKKLR